MTFACSRTALVPEGTIQLYTPGTMDDMSGGKFLDILGFHRSSEADVIFEMVVKGMVEGVTLDQSQVPRSCDSCEFAKTTRKPIQRERVEERDEMAAAAL